MQSIIPCILLIRSNTKFLYVKICESWFFSLNFPHVLSVCFDLVKKIFLWKIRIHSFKISCLIWWISCVSWFLQIGSNQFILNAKSKKLTLNWILRLICLSKQKCLHFSSCCFCIRAVGMSEDPGGRASFYGRHNLHPCWDSDNWSFKIPPIPQAPPGLLFLHVMSVRIVPAAPPQICLRSHLGNNISKSAA
jgi:hypothetical protein